MHASKDSEPRPAVLAAVLALCLLPLAAVVTPKPNDIWFILAYGRGLSSMQSFPHTDFLTFHTDFHLVIQQWLYDVAEWRIWEAFGAAGILAGVVLSSAFLGWTVWKRLRLASDGWRIPLLAVIASGIMSFGRADARPSAISAPLLMLLLITLDSMKRRLARNGEGEPMHAAEALRTVAPNLIAVAAISVLMSNIHASMLPMCWLICLASAVGNLRIWEGVPFLAGRIEHNRVMAAASAACIPLSFAASLANPYGIEAPLYTMFGTSDIISSFITEMRPLWDTAASPMPTIVLLSAFLLSVLAIMLWSVSSSLRRGGRVRLDQVAIALGMCLLQALHLRGLFTLGCVGLTSALMSGTSPRALESARSRFIMAFCVMLSWASSLTVAAQSGCVPGFLSTMSGEVRAAGAAEAIIADGGGAGDRVYCDFEAGSYLEFMGLPVYADPRAEVLCKPLNGQYDVLEELAAATPGTESGIACGADLIGKWDFDYVAGLRGSGVIGAIEEGRVAGYELLSSYSWSEMMDAGTYADLEMAVYRKAR